MKTEKRMRVIFWMTIGVVLFSVLLVSGEAFGVDCANCKQRVDGSWDCKRPIAGLDVGGWRAARGKTPIFQKAHPAVCRIFVDRPVIKAGRRMTETCIGSGVLVWRGTKRAMVLTVHHLFRDRGTKIRVVFPNGEKYEAEQVQTESIPDLGALIIPRPTVEPMTISEDSPPSSGDRVFLCGFDGKSGDYRATPGVVKGYSSHRVSDGFGPRHDLVVVGEAKEGNSGGPIVNSKGELVAIIWGTDGQDSYGTYAARIGVFLTSDKFIAPWRITPWNARTDQERIRANAGAYAPPLVPVAPTTGSGVDLTARSMAQDALNQIEMMTPELLKAKSQLDTLVAASGQSDSRGVATEKKAEEAVKIAEAASTGVAALETGLLGKLKEYVFKLVGSWGLGGGLLATGVAGILFFLIRRLGIRIAQLFDKVTDFIPGTVDDKLLDPLAYKIGAILSGKPIPEYAHTPGLDPWGRPYPGVQVPPAPVDPTVTELLQAQQAQIDALKAAK